jgi:hypothetical protein
MALYPRIQSSGKYLFKISCKRENTVNEMHPSLEFTREAEYITRKGMERRGKVTVIVLT